MDRIPDKLPNTSSQLIAMAATLVGGAEPVREAMKASPEEFSDYLGGRREPPASAFNALVDLIVTEQQKVICANRQKVAQVRARHQS